MNKIILASASKRRSQILKSCGIKHEVMLSGVEEILEEGLHVADIVKRNAQLKAEKVAEEAGDEVIIGADTLVAHGDDIIGKPSDAADAKEILRKFSGNDIEVYTGLCVIDVLTGKKATAVEMSELTVVPLTEDEVEGYFQLLGPYDKAGGFSIEGVGSLLFDNIRGSYFNILGLPMIKLKSLFKEVGLELLEFIEK